MASTIRLEGASLYGFSYQPDRSVIVEPESRRGARTRDGQPNASTPALAAASGNGPRRANANANSGGNSSFPRSLPTVNEPITPQTRYRVLHARKVAQSSWRALVFNVVICAIRLPIAATTVALEWGTNCEAPLQLFLLGIIFHDLIRAIVSFHLSRKLKRLIHGGYGFTLEFERQFIALRSSPAAMVDRLFLFFSFIWHFFGLAWVYQSIDCLQSNPLLFVVSLLVASTFIVLFLFQCVAVCMLLCFASCTRRFAPRFYRWFFGDTLRREQVRRGNEPGEQRNSDLNWIVDMSEALNQLEQLGIIGQGWSRQHTPDHILQQFELISHSEAESSDESCVVCLEDFNEGDMKRKLPCQHSCFHDTCIEEWLHQSVVCPLCKGNVISERGFHQNSRGNEDDSTTRPDVSRTSRAEDLSLSIDRGYSAEISIVSDSENPGDGEDYPVTGMSVLQNAGPGTALDVETKSSEVRPLHHEVSEHDHIETSSVGRDNGERKNHD